MRQLNFGTPPRDTEGKIDWIVRALRQIESASRDNTDEIWDDYTVTNHTDTRTFDANSTTVDELADVVGTLIDDYKNRIF